MQTTNVSSVTSSSGEIISQERAKAMVEEAVKKGTLSGLAGLRFFQEYTYGENAGSRTGAVGTVTGEMSDNDKPTAIFDCLKCKGEHTREKSDWHQCTHCPVCKKPKKRSGKGGGSSVSSGSTGTASVKVEGVDLREQKILDTDDAETRAEKEQFNTIVRAMKARQEEQKKAAAAKAADERKAQQEEARKKKEAEKAASEAKERKDKLAKIRAVAIEMGLPVVAEVRQEMQAEGIATQEVEPQEEETEEFEQEDSEDAA